MHAKKHSRSIALERSVERNAKELLKMRGGVFRSEGD